jgi:hypothetical protein
VEKHLKEEGSALVWSTPGRWPGTDVMAAADLSPVSVKVGPGARWARR